MDTQDRGWADPETWVCQACIGDDGHLKSLVRKNLSDATCTYCESNKRKAAPLRSVMDAVLRGVKYSFNDEASAGCPYDREFSIEYLPSEDVLYQVLESQGLEWPEQLVTDVARAFSNDGWVEAPDGEWMGSHPHERLHWSWHSFAHAVKHRSRFHFHVSNRVHRWGDDLVSVHEMLPFLGQLVRQHRMMRTLSTDAVFHRVRLGAHPLTVVDLGPPPTEKVTAGRMNPVGIPYLYLAFDEKTALAETRAKYRTRATVSSWTPTRELNVIDLVHFPSSPSVFSEKRHEHEMVQFLYAFTEEISQQIDPDGSEHIEYVPTQVVSEYFAQAFKYSGNKRVDGLIYRSSVAPGGKNLVVFPKADARGTQFESMGLVRASSGRVNKRCDSVK